MSKMLSNSPTSISNSKKISGDDTPGPLLKGGRRKEGREEEGRKGRDGGKGGGIVQL